MRVLSSEEERSNCPSVENETERIAAVCALIDCDFPSTLLFQRRIVISLEADATKVPDGCTSRQWTGPLCPTNL